MVKKHPREHVDRKLRIRLKMYACISFLLFCMVLVDIATQVISIWHGIIGIAIGIGVGVVTARMFHISWDHNAKQTVARLDMFGGIILIGYIVFALFRTSIISEFVHGAAIGGVSISIVTGIMLGRVLGTRGKITKILKEQQIIS